MQKLVLVVMFTGITLLCTTAQPWLYQGNTKKSTQASSANFYDIQHAFNMYWKDREVTKGHGFKQFRRWEHFMTPRVYPTGEFDETAFWKAVVQAEEQSTVYEQEWQFLGPSNAPHNINNENQLSGLGRLNCIAFHPSDDNVFWVGSPSGGIWKTTDGGNSFSTTSDQLNALGFSDIAVNPDNPNELYAVTGDGDAGDTYSIGIIKTTDGGNTWETTTISNQASDSITFRKLLLNPDNPNHQIAASNIGILITEDGWESFVYAKDGSGNKLNGVFKDLKFNPGNKDTVYAASYSPFNGQSKVYRSSNGGLNFSPSISGMNIGGKAGRIELAVTQADQNVVYALVCNATDYGFQGLYRSNDRAGSWIEKSSAEDINILGWKNLGNDEGGQGWYDLSLAVSPTNANLVYAGGINIWRSITGGDSWALNTQWHHGGIKPYVHADHHMLKYNPANNKLYSCNDGGIYISDDGSNWDDLSNGLEILQIYRIGVSESDTNRVIMGNQDNGTMLRNEGDWHHILSGDGMECIIDPTNEDIMYAEIYYGEIYRSQDGGNNFTNIMPDQSLEGAWITPFIMSKDDPKVLYIGYNDVYKTTNRGDNWTKISNNLTGENTIKAMAIAPSNENYIYVTDGSRLWVTKNEGLSWKKMNTSWSKYITDIQVSQYNPEEIWVTLSGHSENEKVFISNNAGETWANYSNGLPNVPVNCIAYQTDANNTIYVGTDIGVYTRNATMEQWQPFGTELPKVIVNDLEINYSNNKLYAGTYGRGIWSTEIIDSIGEYPEFYADLTTACYDKEISFIYAGTENYDSLEWDFGADAVKHIDNNTNPVVSYPVIGEKSVSLKLYKDGQVTAKHRNEYIEIVNQLSPYIVSEQKYTCNEPVALNAYGGDDYHWTPAYGLDFDNISQVYALPDTTTTYHLTVSQGNCTGTDSVKLNVIGNDHVCNAVELSYGENGPFANYCATYDSISEPAPPLTDCSGQMSWCNTEGLDNTVWYSFKGSETGIVSIVTDGFDAQTAVYEAESCNMVNKNDAVLLAANDDIKPEDPRSVIKKLTGLSPDKKYWLQVDGSYGGVTGEFTITLSNDAYVHTNTITDDNSEIKIRPNPSKGEFIITSEQFISEGNIEVYNGAGQMVYNRTIRNVAAGEAIHIDLSDKKSGFYLLNLTGPEKRFHSKLILQ